MAHPLFQHVRKQWAGFLALLLVVTGGVAVAAVDPIGSDGDVDLCANRKNGDLQVQKGNRCDHNEKAFAINQTGPQGPQGTIGPQGPAGVVGAEIKKISYLADAGSGSQTIFENADFRLSAACDNSAGPNVVLRPKSDHGGWAQSASASNTSNALYFEDPDTSVSGPRLIQFYNLPEEAGTLTYVSPGGTRVTTITYLVNFLFASSDCVFAGTAITA
jgi:hypothetical protein